MVEPSTGIDTLIGGGRAGCNWQTGHIVGIEGNAEPQGWKRSQMIGGGRMAPKASRGFNSDCGTGCSGLRVLFGVGVKALRMVLTEAKEK